MALYAGLDVGDKVSHLCVVDGEGAILWRGACATDPEALPFTLRKRAPNYGDTPLNSTRGAGFVFQSRGASLQEAWSPVAAALLTGRAMSDGNVMVSRSIPAMAPLQAHAAQLYHLEIIEGGWRWGVVIWSPAAPAPRPT